MSWLPAILRPRVSPTPTAQYHRAPFYPVGAEDAVYEPKYPVIPAILPPVLFYGAGILAGAAPSPFQLPQVYANQTGTVAGVGGTQAGQIVSGPLNIPITTNGSQ